MTPTPHIFPLDGQDSALVCSIVVPVMNEAGNIRVLVEEIAAAMLAAKLAPYEIVFVNDGSTDTTAAEILQMMETHKNVRLIRHSSNHGKSRALRSGISAARARWIVTLDGDGQNDPADIPSLLRAAQAEGVDCSALVLGLRQKRHDSAARRWASRAANGLRAFLLGDGCPDTGCGFKAFPRAAWLELPFFEGMHRYEPALFKLYGHPVRFVPINHRPRLRGLSKYTNWGRALVGISDLFGVMWLQRRTPLVRPAAEEVSASGSARPLDADAA